MTSTRHSPTCSMAPRTSPVIPAERPARAPRSTASADRRGERQRAGPPAGAAAAMTTADDAAAECPSRPDRAGVVGAEAVRPGDGDDAHGDDGRTTTEHVRGDEPGERRRRRQGPHGDDAQDERAAERGDAVGAVPRVLRGSPAAARRSIRRRRHRPCRPDRPRGTPRSRSTPSSTATAAATVIGTSSPSPAAAPPTTAPIERPDDREPQHRGSEVRPCRAAHRHAGQELHGGEKPAAFSRARRTTRRTSGRR